MTQSIKINFKNAQGLILSGIIDMPDDAPKLFGVFAPCFTCVKESNGAVKVSRALAERGAAMLRFDTTGVGQSEGALAKTNFTTRIEDIAAACRALEDGYAAPRLLIGHSISGPAVISAAALIPTLEVVATIGSPKDPQTMIAKFRQYGQISEDGDTVSLNVLGQQKVFEKSFVDDMLAQDLVRDSAALTAALVAFHAPHDKIVDFSNMQDIHDRAVNARSREIFALGDESTHLFEGKTNDGAIIADKLMSFF